MRDIHIFGQCYQDTIPSVLSSETFICCSLLASACFNESLMVTVRRVSGSSADGRLIGACIGFTTTWGFTSTVCTKRNKMLAICTTSNYNQWCSDEGGGRWGGHHEWHLSKGWNTEMPKIWVYHLVYKKWYKNYSRLFFSLSPVQWVTTWLVSAWFTWKTARRCSRSLGPVSGARRSRRCGRGSPSWRRRRRRASPGTGWCPPRRRRPSRQSTDSTWTRSPSRRQRAPALHRCDV